MYTYMSIFTYLCIYVKLHVLFVFEQFILKILLLILIALCCYPLCSLYVTLPSEIPMNF